MNLNIIPYDLSTRSENIMGKLGGPQQAVQYYLKHGHFLGVQNCGIKANLELIDFCDYEIARQNDEKVKRENVEQYIECERISNLYISCKKERRGRVLLILKELEADIKWNFPTRIALFVNTLLKPSLYSELKYRYSLSQIELIKEFVESFTEKISDKLNSIDLSVIKEMTQDDLRKLETEFNIIRNNLSQRIKTVIYRLENDFKESNNFEINAFIDFLISQEKNIFKIRNIGAGTIQEFQDFIERIKNIKIELNQMPHLNQGINKSSLQKLDIQSDLLLNIGDVEEYDLLNIIWMCCVSKTMAKNYQGEIIRELYFESKPLNLKSIAIKYGKSKERARQIKSVFDNEFLPNLIQNIFSVLKLNKLNWPFLDLNNDFVLNKYEFNYSFITEGMPIPNRDWEKLISNEIFSTEYVNVNVYISSIDFKCFAVSEHNYFVRKAVFYSKSINQLFVWADQNIFELESSGLEYNFSILIKRFFIENEIDCPVELLPKVIDLLGFFLVDFSGTRIELRGAKNIEKLNIIEKIRELLLSKQGSVTTNQIVAYLDSNFIEKSNIQILKVLNDTAEFSRFGNNSWILSEENEGITTGSLREICFDLLSSSETPLHITEILNQIKRFRKTNVRSVLTNLKSDLSGAFVFFNCMYIGLSNKKYPKEWEYLPTVIGVQFINELKSLEKRNYSGDYGEYISDKLGYPLVHVNYLLEKRLNKRERISIDLP